MRVSPLRLLVVTGAIALALAAGGFAWIASQTGLTDSSSAARLERAVRRLVNDRSRQVQRLAERVATEGRAVQAAADSRDGLAALFALLTSHAGGVGVERVSATVYIPAGMRGSYRVLAWSEGPAEDVKSAEPLSGPAALFVERGTSGLRLVYVTPIEIDGRRVGVASAETLLSLADRPGSGVHSLVTNAGTVLLTPPPLVNVSPPEPGTHAFVMTGPAGGPLLEARFALADLAKRRSLLERRVIALSALPLALAGLLLTGPLLARRAGARTTFSFVVRSAVAAAGVIAAAVALAGLAAYAALPPAVYGLLQALTALAFAMLFPVSVWWRGRSRRAPDDHPARFAAEHLLAGLVLATALAALSWVLSTRIDAASLAKWRSPLLPPDAGALAYLTTLMLLQVALCWTMAATLAAVAHRWRLSSRRPVASALATLFWVLPSAVLLLRPIGLPRLPPEGWLTVGVAAVLFGWFAAPLRHYYRHTTQAMRLVLLFGALLLPTVSAYPLAVAYADAAMRGVIEREYAPATAAHPLQLRQQLAEAQREIDEIDRNGALRSLADGPVGSSQPAFIVWSQTNLSQSRVTSDIELYNVKRLLVSRFALNVPEYVNRAASQTWEGASCAWRVFDDLRRFGLEERISLKAERGICDAEGRLLGAVVVQVVPDYRALPFVSSANPYAEALGAFGFAPRESRLTDLQVVVYGWSQTTLFQSGRGRAAFPLTAPLFERLYKSRAKFWQDLMASGPSGRGYHVYFSSDRAQIYALGYPITTPFEHITRLAETTALTAAILVLLLVGAAGYAPFLGDRTAPLRVLFLEVRSSFYRKLFLFFVLAAIGPVILLALAFNAYMTASFQADVESEAANVVTVARRVLEGLAAADPRVGLIQAAPTDDMMVWISQVIDQDVNLFDRSQLVATSQRDLFDSGLLATRTPASAYRRIALDRLPTFVADDRLGAFNYLVAAAPVPARGQDAVLSVPLVLRQREIEREIDELNRGILAGAVVVILFAAGLGASVAGRISDPVARLTRATRQITAGRLDVRIVADTADELRRLVDDFNSMAATLGEQRTALARTNQLKAWNEMARQVAHEIKNPLTPIQLAAEHLQRVHEDQGRPLGGVFDQCLVTILGQVRLLRKIAGEFSTFAADPAPSFSTVALAGFVEDIVGAYRAGLSAKYRLEVKVPAELPAVRIDRTLVARALTNLVENAFQAMPGGGVLTVAAAPDGASAVTLVISDTGVGMDAEAKARAFEPYFSTKTAGSGLGLPNAKRNVELSGGSLTLDSVRGQGTTITVRLPVAPLPSGTGAA